MLRDPTGLPAWADFPQGFEDGYDDGGDFLGLSGFGFAAPCIQDSSEVSLRTSPSQGVSLSSYDISSATSSSTTTTTFDTDVSLSSYLMDGNVRAMLKKVTVNEGTLNQAIQSLGGGEKGLKELMGYIMAWVREHQNGSSDAFSLSQNLENMHKSPPVSTAPKPLHHSLDETTTTDSPQYYQPCTKSRRLGKGADDCSTSSGGATFVNVSGSVAEEFQYPQQSQPSTGNYNSGIGPMMPPQGMHLQQQQQQQQQQANPPPGFFSFAPGHDDLSRMFAANTTRAARRNRIARQRQQSLPSSSNKTTAAPALAPAVSWASACPSPSASDSRSADTFLAVAPPVAAVVPGRKVNNADKLTFLLQKELRPSDVGNLGRIILPKKEAEMYLPILALREGVVLKMEDFDSGVCWNIRYRFWPNNKSRMYLLENTGEFVKHHRLQEGDLIILYRNQQGIFVLRGKKNTLLETKGGAQRIQQKNAHSLARRVPEASKTEDVLKESDFELGNWSCQKLGKERGFGLEFEDRKATKAGPAIFVGDDDPFFKEDVMHNIGSSFGARMLQPLEKFPSLNLDSQFEEILADLSKDDPENEPKLPKTEPA